jgi:transcriptional regulator with XRE-family HTH domain
MRIHRMTAELCRAGRAILKLSQEQLADLAGVSRATVHGYEAGSRETNYGNELLIAEAFEREGVEFFRTKDGEPGLVIRKKRQEQFVATGDKSTLGEASNRTGSAAPAQCEDNDVALAGM